MVDVIGDKFANSPKVDYPGTGPKNDNNYVASQGTNMSYGEVYNFVRSARKNNDLGKSQSADDEMQKAVSRYNFSNLLEDSSSAGDHTASLDTYRANRESGNFMNLPTVFLRGQFLLRVLHTNSSNDVNVKLGTLDSKPLKKKMLDGQIGNIEIGELVNGEVIKCNYNETNEYYLLEGSLGIDEIAYKIGKYDVDEIINFTTTTPNNLNVGSRIINSTSGTIIANHTVGDAGTTVTAEKVYELYEIVAGPAYKWREVSAKQGDLSYNKDTDMLYSFNGSSWGFSLPDATTTSKGIVQLVTLTELQNDTGGDSVVTSDVLNDAMENSKTTNGYTYLPNGLILQWGTTTSISSEGTLAVTLPVTYANSVLSAYSTPNRNTNVGGGVNSTYCYVDSTSQITIVNDGYVGGTTTVFWFTIGY